MTDHISQPRKPAMFLTRKGLVAAVAVAAVFGACSDSSLVPIPTLLSKLFGATLTPGGETPAVTGVTSSGVANITIIDSNTIRVETRVTTIDSVTQAHIHAGDATAPGPVMVFLAGPYSTLNNSVGKDPSGSTTLTGVLSTVDVTRGSTFQSVYNFDSVFKRVQNGTAYVNVHTKKNPGGEIRGQIAKK